MTIYFLKMQFNILRYKIITHHTKYWFRTESSTDAESGRNFYKDLDIWHQFKLFSHRLLNFPHEKLIVTLWWRNWKSLDQVIELNITSENQMDILCHQSDILRDIASFIHYSIWERMTWISSWTNIRQNHVLFFKNRGRLFLQKCSCYYITTLKAKKWLWKCTRFKKMKDVLTVKCTWSLTRYHS